MTSIADARLVGRRTARGLAAAAVIAALAAALGARAWAQETPAPEPDAPGQAQPGTPEGAPGEQFTRTEEHEDWTVRCGRPDGEAELCEMVQQPVGEDGQPVMAVAVGRVPGSPNPGMIILLPLGISLPPGVELRIDDGAAIEAPVERCQRQGCQVEMLLEPDLLAALKGGSRATVGFQVHQPDGLQRVRVPFSLLGFTAALEEVQGPG